MHFWPCQPGARYALRAGADGTNVFVACNGNCRSSMSWKVCPYTRHPPLSSRGCAKKTLRENTQGACTTHNQRAVFVPWDRGHRWPRWPAGHCPRDARPAWRGADQGRSVCSETTLPGAVQAGARREAASPHCAAVGAGSLGRRSGRPERCAVQPCRPGAGRWPWYAGSPDRWTSSRARSGSAGGRAAARGRRGTWPSESCGCLAEHREVPQRRFGSQPVGLQLLQETPPVS